MLEIAERLAERLGALWLSVVRTWVPAILGGLFAWLASRGFTLSEDTQAAVVAAATVLAVMAWYLVGRMLEQLGTSRRIRWLAIVGGLMLGIPKPPEYVNRGAILEASASTVTRQIVGETPGESAARRAARVAKRE